MAEQIGQPESPVKTSIKPSTGLLRQRIEVIKGIPGITPEKARERLSLLGYTPELCDQMFDRNLGSHETRALIYISRGKKSQKLEDVYRKLFPETEEREGQRFPYKREEFTGESISDDWEKILADKEKTHWVRGILCNDGKDKRVIAWTEEEGHGPLSAEVKLSSIVDFTLLTNMAGRNYLEFRPFPEATTEDVDDLATYFKQSAGSQRDSLDIRTGDLTLR